MGTSKNTKYYIYYLLNLKPIFQNSKPSEKETDNDKATKRNKMYAKVDRY